MKPSSRTPEGEPNRCPVCGHRVIIEPSEGTFDATCPYCGCLLWFDRDGGFTPDMSLADKSRFGNTRRQIRSLVLQIANLSKTNVPDEEYYQQFLPRVVSALAAHAGAVWTFGRDGQLALRHQIGLEKAKLGESLQRQAQHARLLGRVFADGQDMLVPPHERLYDQDRVEQETPAVNPTDFLLVFGLLKADQQTVGLVEVFQRTEAALTTQRGYLRFVAQMCELANDFLARQRLRCLSESQEFWIDWDRFARSVHASLNIRETAQTIANEGQRMIACDRLSVMVRKGARFRIVASSGHVRFNKWSKGVRLLEKLVTAAVADGKSLWCAGDTGDLPSHVADAVRAYINKAHPKTVAVLPLRRPPSPKEHDSGKRLGPELLVGTLVVELLETDQVSPNLVRRAEAVREHSSIALNNAIERRKSFPLPLWHALKRMWLAPWHRMQLATLTKKAKCPRK